MDYQRLFTGLALGFLAIFAVFLFSHTWFMILTAVLVTLGALEVCDLAGVQKNFAYRIGYLVTLWILLWLADWGKPLAIFLGVIFAVFACVVASLPLRSSAWIKNRWLVLFLGLLMLVPMWAAANILQVFDRPLLFMVILLVSLSDTAAYYTGSIWGKHKLAPTLSPKKTIEGLAGGIVVSLIISNIYAVLVMHKMPAWPSWLALCVLTIVVGVFGDLFESLLKRHTDCKDSGSLLPGHGGILDRIDSMALALPVFAFGAIVLKLV